MVNLILNIVDKVFGNFGQKVLDIIDQTVEDKDLKNKLRAEIEKQLIDIKKEQLELLKFQLETYKDIYFKELQSDSWLAKNWRPLVSLIIALVWLYTISPIPVLLAYYLNIDPKLLTISQENQSTLLYMVSATFLVSYGIGRSIEKIIKFRK